mgnify:CR=1 FL=1
MGDPVDYARGRHTDHEERPISYEERPANPERRLRAP